MGRMVRRKKRRSMGREWRDSRREVVRARTWVARVAKTRCQHVRRMAARSVSTVIQLKRLLSLFCQTQSRDWSAREGRESNRRTVSEASIVNQPLIEQNRAIREEDPAEDIKRRMQAQGARIPGLVEGVSSLGVAAVGVSIAMVRVLDHGHIIGEGGVGARGGARRLHRHFVISLRRASVRFVWKFFVAMGGRCGKRWKGRVDRR